MIDFKKLEEEILEFWEKKDIYAKIKKKNKDGKKFYFLQGPPYTSGKLHIGHAWNNSLKDIILRYKRMKGFDVWDRGGYDMHGLPTEHKVQKKLGLKTKEDILNFGVDKFVKECMNFSIEHAEYMNEDLWKIGIWMDNKNAYKPIEKGFISGEWLFFKKAWEQGRLYKGKKVMHWDAETETSLAKHDLEYKTTKDTSVFLKFKKKNTDNEYFVIFTTTPWTIPFNLAIMVNPNLKYVKAEVDGEYWILAKDLASVFVSGLLGKKFKIIDEFMGSELEGQEYEHIFYDELKDVYDKLKKESPKIHSVILSEEYVDTSIGTGLVHCAPGSGPEDQEVAARYGIEPFNTLNERGEFENLGKFTGRVARKDDGEFIKDFEEAGALVAKTEVEHEYPHSDRSKKPVIFRTTEQWFLRTSDLADKLLKMNSKVSWVPKRAGESYDRWAENLKDNGVTRQRFWGCPVPIWINEKDSEDILVIGSVEELEKLTGKKFNDLSLHKPMIDKVVIEKNGKKYRRIPDVADVWIDSGTASWNCLYNDKKLIKKYFPADLVLEATEQTRLWFSLLQICSAVVFDKSCYNNVFVHGMMLDFQGMKMSKSLGNVISPYKVIDQYSADILRYYICQVSAGDNVNFNWEDIKVKQRNLLILYNIANYLADLERQEIKPGKPGAEERWIISRYNSSLKKATELLEEYRLDEVIGVLEGMFIELSRDYIKLVRDKSSENKAVLETVKEIYVGILKAFSIVCPFITDSLWKKLGQKEESVHLCSWPKYDAKKIDMKLEKEFEFTLEIIEKGLAERDKAGIGLKWPLASAKVMIENRVFGKDYFPDDLKEIIARQLNIKEIVIKKKDNASTAVELNTKLTPELEAEGFSRELARKIQSERKKLGLQKGDIIELKISSGKKISEMVKKHLDFLKDRTNSSKIDFVLDIDDNSKVDFEIKKEKFGILITMQ